MKKGSKKQKRKEQIIILAEDAKEKINQNRILTENIDNYNKHIQMIKSFMNKYSESNKITEKFQNNNNNKTIFIKDEFKKYFYPAIGLVVSVRDTYFDDVSGDNLNYNQIHMDAFILSNSLEQKLNIIKKLKQSIHFSKDYNIFREPKRETLINSRYSEDYIDDINQELQRYALYEFRQFNKYSNRCMKKLKKVNKYKNKKNFFQQIINYFEQINYGNIKNNNSNLNSNSHLKISGNNYNNNKIVKVIKMPNKKYYKSDNDNNFYNTINLNNYSDLNIEDFGNGLSGLNTYEIDQTFNFGNNHLNNNLFSLSNNINSNNKNNSNKKSKKINLPTVEELFDLTNNEGEKEAIIDDELHSDDEIVFETKIKAKKKIIKDYLPNIKKVIPNLYLSQIEFNKSKVMNEADLYSHQRRQFQMQNVDENIKLMKKKLKIIKRRCKINEQKYETMKNFTKECENDYNRLKAMKLQMSVKQKVTFMKKEFFTQHTKDIIDEEDELNYQKELDDYLNDPELNDPYFEQYQNLETEITQRRMDLDNNNRIKKIQNDNIDNNENTKKKYEYTRTHRERKKEKIKRANSK